MNPWMMMYVGGTVATSTIKRRVEEERRKDRDATGPRKHNRNRAAAEARRNAERANRQGEQSQTAKAVTHLPKAQRDVAAEVARSLASSGHFRSPEEIREGIIMETHECRTPEYDSSFGCFLRVYSLMIGHVILLFCGLAIFHNPSRFLGAPDAYFWATVGTLLGARYVDIRYFKGTTAEGKPASTSDWRRYAVFLLVVSIALWLFVNGAGRLWQPPA